MGKKNFPPEIFPIIVIDDKGKFTGQYKSTSEVRKDYPGVIFNTWEQSLMGVNFLIMAPGDPEDPSVRRVVLCAVVTWVLSQLPREKQDRGITKAEHEKIHHIKKMLKQD